MGYSASNSSLNSLTSAVNLSWSSSVAILAANSRNRSLTPLPCISCSLSKCSRSTLRFSGQVLSRHFPQVLDVLVDRTTQFGYGGCEVVIVCRYHLMAEFTYAVIEGGHASDSYRLLGFPIRCLRYANGTQVVARRCHASWGIDPTARHAAWTSLTASPSTNG